jgi:hypothetical protein
MNIDQFEGSNRPPEMEEIVKAIAKPRPAKHHSDSMIN